MDSLATQVIVDSLKNMQTESGGSWILHHVMDGNYLDFSPFGKIYLPHLELFGIDISITRHVVFMWLAAILLTYVFIRVAKSYQNSLVPKGSTNFWEVFIVFVRDEIAKPTIGRGYEKFLPYLLTAFFFILFGNFLGLIPFSATFTSNIAVTATLATMSFLVIQLGGIRNNGFLGYFKGLIPHGVPVFLLPIMIVVEVLGLFTKPFALAIRLFANMTAGHIVIYALISLIFVMQSYLISPVSVGMALFIYSLEVLVALLQAYIFTMLSSLFIGMAVHQEH
ncbi:MAG: F0F1 ATP synthase subunit A [Ignavibacterium sp.]|jgi:F-type H+-transporting ATPase subunit a|uniref:ATP synthase subunit a n=1 Tax=Ignavibacterium album TaxID=591197 RepID=A0A7V3E7N2_9BACT|nr:F0F1 ATP synthase subunit A [Ignavibacterium album]MCA2005040.1 F0F1 ATP synthase subunit A [Ignavibacterium sp.]MCX8105141.1 F0F1 ATP synthase subunit A [Ignavibacterium album]